jgi:hypothetical protein
MQMPNRSTRVTRKLRKLGRTALALAATLSLAAGTMALTAVPAAASPTDGAGSGVVSIALSGTPSAWSANGSGFGTFVVGGNTWPAGSFSLGFAAHRTDWIGLVQSGVVDSFSLSGTALSGETIYFSGTGTLVGPQVYVIADTYVSSLEISVSGIATVCNPGCSQGSLTIAIAADAGSCSTYSCGYNGPFTASGIPPLFQYWSDKCAQLGVAPKVSVIDGYLGGTHLILGTATAPSSSNTTWVCAAFDDGTNHQGGRVAITAAAPGIPDPRPNEAGDCESQPGNVRLRSGTYSGGNRYWLDVTPSVQNGSAAWVCVKLEPYADYKIVIPTGGGAVPVFKSDPTVPHNDPPYFEPTSPGSASSYCQTAGGTKTKLINALVGGSRVWLYALQESATRASICVRSDAASTGKKLTLDALGGQAIVTPVASNLPECTYNQIDDNGPPPFSVYFDEAPPGNPPVSVCVKVNTTYLSVKADSGGGTGVVTQMSD